jgi:hypothetical protein
MNPYALPRASSGRFTRRRALAVRAHFHQPCARTRFGWEPTPVRAGFGLCALAVMVGFLSVMLLACAVIQ